jgi:hypothetical protein
MRRDPGRNRAGAWRAVRKHALGAMLAKGGEGLNPLELTGGIVMFYIERLAPRFG